MLEKSANSYMKRHGGIMVKWLLTKIIAIVKAVYEELAPKPEAPKPEVPSWREKLKNPEDNPPEFTDEQMNHIIAALESFRQRELTNTEFMI